LIILGKDNFTQAYIGEYNGLVVLYGSGSFMTGSFERISEQYMVLGE
jgi:hypothetical protein